MNSDLGQFLKEDHSLQKISRINKRDQELITVGTTNQQHEISKILEQSRNTLKSISSPL